MDFKNLWHMHPNDDMFHGDYNHYFRTGCEAAHLIARAQGYLNAEIESICELPCGYGRVTRHISHFYRNAHIDSVDILPEAARFVSENFGVNGIQVLTNDYFYKEIPKNNYDVVFIGSLVTHTNEVSSNRIISSVSSKLKTGGILVLTTHGSGSFEMLTKANCYQISEQDRANLICSYKEGLYGFCRYAKDHTFEKSTVEFVGDSYGISLTPKKFWDKVLAENGLIEKAYLKSGWDNHQDVFWVQKI